MKTAILYTLGSLFLSQMAHADSYARELAAIRFIESSDGSNLNHQVINYGLHKGTRAGGEYGIMPITAREKILGSKNTLRTYRYFASLDNDQLTEELNTNKQLDRAVATYMWSKLRKKFSADQAACAWFRGPYADACRDDAALDSDPYVTKFRATMDRLNTMIVSNP